ncbi:MAG: hypothetical protein H0W02_17810 [Ktedonobacteraceae bacterium]|nr:hypothetical protein [Ktedonobacteraceae bacterium]
MAYRFAQERQDYADFATGRVFQSIPGHTAFPVRLASEIFQRCVALYQQRGGRVPCILYDPCCGGASLLCAATYLHWSALEQVIGSDIDPQALQLAGRNLSLLTLSGLEARTAQLQIMRVGYGKPSHAEALESAQRLHSRLSELLSTHSVTTRIFLADATQQCAIQEHLGDLKADIVMMDIPYGLHSSWQVPDRQQTEQLEPIQQVLAAMLPVLSPQAIVAVAASRQQKFAYAGYRRLDHFTIGKRRIVFLTPDKTLS